MDYTTDNDTYYYKNYSIKKVNYFSLLLFCFKKVELLRFRLCFLNVGSGIDLDSQLGVGDHLRGRDEGPVSTSTVIPLFPGW